MSSTRLTEELKKHFGFSSFKGLQEDVITHILERKNAFVIMPTGGGKSMCYQLPALMSEGTAIVVSPLIALMKNQVDAIRGISQDDGVAHVLNSSLTKTAVEQVKRDIKTGVTKLLFVAPESLAKEDNLAFLKQTKLSFLAVDEAHCISEWGHDFRPDYRNLRFMLKQIDQDLPVIALTATATPKVQEDILKNLQITDAKVFKASFNRPNLYYEVRPKTDQVEIDIIKFIRERKGKSGIIYCLSRKKVEELAQTLQVNDINAIPYHAGLDAKTRANNQDAFLKEACDVVVATIAFGMGIDKPDVRFVIHHDIPKSIESYYQETGRAGRDGGEGHCLAFYAYKDIEKLEKFMSGKPVAEYDLKNEIYQHYQVLCSTFYKKNRTGDLMSRISEDVSKVRMYFGPALMYSINTVALFIIVISYMVSVAPSLTLYTLLPLPVLSVTIYKLSRAINIRSTAVQETLAKLSAFAQETFSGIGVIKSYNLQSTIENQFSSLAIESKTEATSNGSK